MSMLDYIVSINRTLNKESMDRINDGPTDHYFASSNIVDGTKN